MTDTRVLLLNILFSLNWLYLCLYATARPQWVYLTGLSVQLVLVGLYAVAALRARRGTR